MEHYDVIIVGAGIAGTSLAYNLSKECPDKKVLLIDKKESGANAAYGYRTVDEKTVKKYYLPYEHIYKGIKVGTTDKTYFTLNKKTYFVSYKKVCESFLNKSKVKFIKEKAIKKKNNILKTNKKKYSFDNLIDCSGKDYFEKKFSKDQLPFRYFIAKVRVLNNKLADCNYCYFQFNDSGYIEELYPMKDKTLQGDWQYVKEINFKKIIPDEKNLYKKFIKNPKILQEDFAVIPVTPVFPIRKKNIVFLGDSFGNSIPSSGSGIRVILETSKMLAKKMRKKEIESYEKIWRMSYLDAYIRYLVVKFDTYHNSKFSQWVKKTPTRVELLPILSKYPKIFGQILDGDSNLKLPKEIKSKYPKRAKIIQLYYYIYLKLKYVLM